MQVKLKLLFWNAMFSLLKQKEKVKNICKFDVFSIFTILLLDVSECITITTYLTNVGFI